MMIANIDWLSLGLCIAGAVAVGLVIYHAVAGYYYLRYYVARRGAPDAWKCQPDRHLRRGQQRNAALVGSLNLTLGGVITGVLVYAILHGWKTPIYFAVADYGWTYTLLSTAMYFVLVDAFAYYVHRGLHIKSVYRRVHRYHHTFVATSPYVAAALHPVELLSLQATSFLPILVMPLHAVSIAVVLIYVLVFNIIDHSGVHLTSRIPWQASSLYHDDHHAHFHCNFGQHLTIWDRMHGTLRRKGRSYGREVFGGRGVSDSAGRPDADEFVSY